MPDARDSRWQIACHVETPRVVCEYARDVGIVTTQLNC
jgi:hypothetical protein